MLSFRDSSGSPPPRMPCLTVPAQREHGFPLQGFELRRPIVAAPLQRCNQRAASAVNKAHHCHASATGSRLWSRRHCRL